MHIPDLIVDLALMLLVAGAMTLLFKKLGQPLVLGYIITGFLVGPYFGYFPGVTDAVSVHTWSEIGIIILMFSLGLEFNLHKLASVGGTAIITAITEVVCMLGIGVGVGQLMGWTIMNSIFLGCLLAMSSTTIIIKAFDDLKLRGQKFTELVFGTLVIEDIAGIFMMVILSTVAVSQGITGGELAGTLLTMILYLALWLLLGIFLIPTLLKKTKSLMNEETLMVVSLGLCFGMVLLATHLGFSSALGAFLAGSLLAGTVLAEKIEHVNKPVKDLFGAVFFISVGMMVDPAVVVQYIVPIVVITLVTIFGKSFFSAIGVLLSGQPLRIAVKSGLSLAQIGEFSFIIAALGISLGVTSDFIYPIVVAVSVITTLTTPYTIKSTDAVYGFLNKHLPKRLLNYLNRNTSENQMEVEQDSNWASFIKKYFSQLLIYGVIMIGIILLAVTFLWPFLTGLMNYTVASVLSLVIILATMAPFINQCLTKRNKYFIPLWFGGRSNRLPLLALTILRLAIMVVLVILPARLIFDFSTWFMVLGAVLLVFLISRSDKLIAPYMQIEARFLSNFNERNLESRKDTEPEHRWLDEQIYVAKFVCDENVIKRGSSLMDMSWSRLGIKVIKIVRDEKHINIPAGKEKLVPGDLVYVTGSAMQLNNLNTISKIELSKNESGAYHTLREFVVKQQEHDETDQLYCYALTVEKDDALVGKSIKDSGIKNEWECFLLGLERNLLPMVSPDINMRINAGDIIWLLGSRKMLSKMVKADVI